MSEKTIIVTDELTRKSLNIKNAEVLYPSCICKTPWSISIHEYYAINDSITQLSNKTAEYLLRLPMLNLRYSSIAIKFLIRANSALILSILIDRLIRIIRLIRHRGISDCYVINTAVFAPPIRMKDLYALSKDSWEFNQFIINLMLKELPGIDVPGKGDLFPSGSWDTTKWSQYYGFGHHPANRSIIGKLQSCLQNPTVLMFKCRDLLHSSLLRFSSKGRKIPVSSLGYNEYHFIKKGLYWPLGKLCELPQNLPAISFSPIDNERRKTIIEQTQSFFIDHLKIVLKKIGEDQIAHHILATFSDLFFLCYPQIMFENAEYFCSWSIKQFAAFRKKHYFTGSTAGSDLNTFYSFAAKELGFIISAIQHSTWGGYLANIPNVAESNIAGSDYYITNGWTHQEPQLPAWKKAAVPAANPHYSELRKISLSKKTSSKIKAGRRVLLAPGHIFYFPVFHAGTFYHDQQQAWAKEIEETISGLVEQNIDIILKPYAPRITAILKKYGVWDRWIRAGKDKLTLCGTDEKGSARYFFNKVGASIWDMPGGGLAESIILKTPAFSLWNDKLIQCQPQARDTINKLLQTGIFNPSGKDIAHNVAMYFDKADWWEAPKRQQAIQEFMERFARTTDGWVKEWRGLIANHV